MESLNNFAQFSAATSMLSNTVDPIEDYSVLLAKQAIVDQSVQIRALAEQVDSDFEAAAHCIHESRGHLIICGMGKSGHIGKKLAATLASTGTPSFFVHPGEAFHGDLGMITPDSVVLLISNSGETDEVLKLIPSLKHFGVKIIALTGNKNSTLSVNADFTINAKVDREICPNNLAPTSSTTAALVMGDALAVALIHLRKFQPTDFAMFHPGGSLGRRLLTKVSDVMMSDNLPIVSPQTTIEEAILVMTNSKIGLAIVLDEEKLYGVVTDGDLRRALSQKLDITSSLVTEIMSEQPITIIESAKVTDAEELMREKHIKHLLVTNATESVVGVMEFYQ
ncbi:KpsF/GutQ family sugar-phosphate isomerase [Flocculibacter collagenilyticus]|uniref:KpsF/GutQ family sugar-phosphate isomerase n=1 Tax=Flocculibacter collagenilyticus TaxID=2744479 RepID=UPI001F38025C|nr:KpsF/GutQ family sugar-phosphate isomerase [Flocculibacter collagenilyticus]